VQTHRRQAQAGKGGEEGDGGALLEGGEPIASQAHEEEMPRVHVTRRQALLFAVFVVTALAFLYFVLPQLGVVKHTLDRLNGGNVWWIAVAVGLELASIASYVALFQGVHVPPGSPITFRESYLITMAGLAATRLFAAGGAGGVAVTAWALRRSGMARREVAQRMIAFLVLTYGLYMVAMIVCGVGLYTGLFPGRHPFAITIGPAIVAAVVIGLALGAAFVPADLERRLGKVAKGEHRPGRWLRRLAAGPASVSSGIRFAWQKLSRPELALLGTLGWWAFNIAVLYAAFRVFGEAPPIAVLIQAYFVGLLANLLPLPGGIGGVDGGMIGALAAFGVSVGLAVPAVLVYRLLAFWLPTVPGAIAYFQLRRRVARWAQDDTPTSQRAHDGAAPAGALQGS
jgi:putative heme transporter